TPATSPRVIRRRGRLAVMTDRSGARPGEADDEALQQGALGQLAAALHALVGLEQPVVELIAPAPAEVAHLRLGVAAEAGATQGVAQGHALGAEPRRLGQPAQLPAERAEQLHRVVALVEQAAEERQRLAGAGGRD